MSDDRKEQDRRFRILALYTEQHAGRERVTHVRLRECSTVREGFGENAIARRGLPGARTSGGSRGFGSPDKLQKGDSKRFRMRLFLVTP